MAAEPTPMHNTLRKQEDIMYAVMTAMRKSHVVRPRSRVAVYIPNVTSRNPHLHRWLNVGTSLDSAE